jgi:hypothetical protein
VDRLGPLAKIKLVFALRGASALTRSSAVDLITCAVIAIAIPAFADFPSTDSIAAAIV